MGKAAKALGISLVWILTFIGFTILMDWLESRPSFILQLVQRGSVEVSPEEDNSKYLTISGLQLAKELKRETLQGLKGVDVEVEDIRPAIERAGLTRGELQAYVERRLLRVGLRVVTEEERRKQGEQLASGTVSDEEVDTLLGEPTPGLPYFHVSITDVKSRTRELYAISIQLNLNEIVNLSREPSFEKYATTWSTGSVTLVVGVEEMKGILRVVDKHLDEFINDYVLANPKTDGSE